MRACYLVSAIILAGVIAAPDIARAQESAASAAVGVGVFGAEPAASMDVGLDVAGPSYAMGLGARLRWVVDEGFRQSDWDERSEWATLLRYLLYVRDVPEGVRASVAMGELGGVMLGNGSVIAGYASGIDVDRRHLGVELHIESQHYGAEAVLDDLVAPRMGGVRAYRVDRGHRRTLEVGASMATDAVAPASMNTRRFVGLAALDGRFELHRADRSLGGGAYVDLVASSTRAAGAHIGLTGSMALSPQLYVSLRGELRAGTDRYLPGWFGPLYEHDRQQMGAMARPQLEVARAGGLDGLGSAFEVHARYESLGDVRVGYSRRVGLADVLALRLAVPYDRLVQGAVWVAAEVGEGARTWVGAVELRSHFTPRLFAAFEAAHAYRRITIDTGLDTGSTWEPLWQATAGFGAVVGL